MNENLEKYIGELSPEMQEKARQCKDMKELNALLAENDVELSEDALCAVSGGCSNTDAFLSQGDIMKYPCPECGQKLRYWDMVYEGGDIWRFYCDNASCSSYRNGLWACNNNSGKDIYKY